MNLKAFRKLLQGMDPEASIIVQEIDEDPHEITGVIEKNILDTKGTIIERKIIVCTESIPRNSR